MCLLLVVSCDYFDVCGVLCYLSEFVDYSCLCYLCDNELVVWSFELDGCWC